MKKILAWVLVLVLVVGMLAGCGRQKQPDVPATNPTDPSVDAPDFVPAGATAEDAMKYLCAIYKDTEEPTPTPVNYDRYGIVRIAGIPFTVVWSVDVGEDLVKIIVNEDGSVTIDVNELCEVATPYALTATITDEYGNTASHSWNMILPAAVDMAEIVNAAYELAPGESLPYQSTLRGKITAINTVYSAEYKNITVTIEVEGAEGKPIMCYRLKGEGIDKLLVGNIITVTGTLKNYNGTIEFDAGCTLDAVEQGDAVEAITDPGEILKAAYALKEDTQLPNPATLTGTVIEIDSPYDPSYGNISVVIEVEGYPQYPILCYRMKGVDVSKIAVNDLITVTGIIKNYQGTIEFDAGCQMTNRVSGGGVAQGPSSDQNKILNDASKLAPGEKLPYIATLTGEIYSVDTPYDSGYGNITVTILVGGKKIQCYRMVGDGIDQIRETDTITVTGIIENYNGKLEFGAKSRMDSWTKGPRNVNYGPLKEETAYRLYVKQQTLEKTLYFTGDCVDNKLDTSVLGSEGVDIFVERVSGKGVRFYYMDGETKTYIGVEDYLNSSGQTRGRVTVGATVSSIWTYDSIEGIYVSEVQAGKHFLGAYGNFETITASWTGYLESSSQPQYKAKFMLASDVPADDAPALAYGTYTTAPEVGIAYKLGLDQTTKEATYYFTGVMSTYYGATDTDYSKGVDVYLENADGGYYLYFMDGSAKQYVYIVANGTHMNFTYSTSNKSVFTYDTELNSLYTSVDGAVYYMGTYGSYVTVGTTAQNKVSTSYVTHLYTSATGGDGGVTEPDEPDVPDVPPTDVEVNLVTNPAASTAYKMGMDKGDGTILYFNGQTESASVTYRLATTTNVEEAVDVYLEEVSGGYLLYFMNGETKTYIRVYHRTDGDPGKGKGSLEFVTTAPSELFDYDTTANTLVYDYDGNNAYYMGTYSTFTTFSVSNTSYITGGNAANVDVTQFPARFYTVTTTEGGDDTTGGDDTGSETPDTPVTGSGTLELTVTSMGIANQTYYSGTATVDGIDFDLTQIGNYGNGVQMRDKNGNTSILFNTVALPGNITKIELTSNAGKTVYNNADAVIFSFGDAQDNLTYTTKLSTVAGQTSYTITPEGDFTFFKIEHDLGFTLYWDSIVIYYGNDAGETPDEPDAPEAGLNQLMTTAPVDGDMIAIVNGDKAMTVNASGKKLAGETATVTDGALTVTEAMAQLIVVIDENGYYTFVTADGKYLTSGATGNALSLADAPSIYSLWTVEAGDEGIFYIKSVNAKYGEKVQSLEFFSGFTTYGHNTTAAFQMQLYKVGTGSVTPPETPEEQPADYTEMTIAEAREAETGTKVKVSGVVARITYANGMKPSGVILVDETASIYVYDSVLASQCAIGNTVTLCASKTYWILESEQANAAKYGYAGCNQLEEAKFVEVEATSAEFNKTWIEETSVKEILDTPVTEDITSKIFKVNALVKEVPGNGFTNYYFYDLDGTTGAYTYSQCNGSDFAWLREFDGKVCTVYIMALNAKSSASDCYWRFLPIEVKDEGFDASTVNFAENAVKFYGVPQFLPEYTGDPAKELLTSADNELLGYAGAKLSYVSSDPSVVSIDENVLHCHKTGTVKITVSGELNGQTYSEDVTIVVDIFDVNAEYPTVAEAVAAELDTTVTVKGVVGPSLVNKSGFYLIDDTGVIAVLVDSSILETLEIGYEVILEGTREYHAKSGSSRGNSCLNNIKVLYNGYGNHAYSTASFDGELTLAEFAALSVDTDHTTSVYTVTATVEVVETAYYTSIKLVDGETSINLYSSSANQYNWLKEYAGQEITMELAPCNWSSKEVYPACVLAVIHGNGSKTVNTLNFD